MDIITEFKPIEKKKNKFAVTSIVVISVVAFFITAVFVWLSIVLADVRKSELERSLNVIKDVSNKSHTYGIVAYYIKVLEDIKSGDEEDEQDYFDEALLVMIQEKNLEELNELSENNSPSGIMHRIIRYIEEVLIGYDSVPEMMIAENHDLQQAFIYEIQRDYEKSIDKYDAALSSLSGDIEDQADNESAVMIYLHKAYCYARMFELSKAIGLLQASMEKTQDSELKKITAKLIISINELVLINDKIEGQSTDNHLLRGLAFYKVTNFDDAERELNIAKDITEDDYTLSQIAFYLGRINEHKSLYELALEYYKEVLNYNVEDNVYNERVAQRLIMIQRVYDYQDEELETLSNDDRIRDYVQEFDSYLPDFDQAEGSSEKGTSANYFDNLVSFADRHQEVNSLLISSADESSEGFYLSDTSILDTDAQEMIEGINENILLASADAAEQNLQIAEETAQNNSDAEEPILISAAETNPQHETAQPAPVRQQNAEAPVNEREQESAQDEESQQEPDTQENTRTPRPTPGSRYSSNPHERTASQSSTSTGSSYSSGTRSQERYYGTRSIASIQSINSDLAANRVRQASDNEAAGNPPDIYDRLNEGSVSIGNQNIEVEDYQVDTVGNQEVLNINTDLIDGGIRIIMETDSFNQVIDASNE